MPYLTLTLTENLKLQLSPGLVASYHIQPGNGVGLFWDKHTHVYLLTGKCVVDFLLVLIELFSLGVTGQALPAKIDRKSVISLQPGQFDSKFQV